jgi:PTH1 family peptidyl-tRNA hydrolase
MAVDLFAMSANNPPWKEEHSAHTCKFKMDDVEIMLAKPMTFMNKSGESVQALMAFYKIPLENILVIHDEVDQVYGAMKFNKNRGHGYDPNEVHKNRAVIDAVFKPMIAEEMKAKEGVPQ